MSKLTRISWEMSPGFSSFKEKGEVESVRIIDQLQFRCASVITLILTFFFFPISYFLIRIRRLRQLFHYFLHHFLRHSTKSSFLFVMHVFIGGPRRWNRADCVKNKWEDAIDILLSSMSEVLFSFIYLHPIYLSGFFFLIGVWFFRLIYGVYLRRELFILEIDVKGVGVEVLNLVGCNLVEKFMLIIVINSNLAKSCEV